MWILFAFGSALFAGITSVLAKCGIQKTDSTVATAIRTMVVLIFSWIMVFIIGSQSQITMIDYKIWIFLVLSGLATLTPIAAPKPNPIVPSPPDVRSVLGSLNL